MASSLDDMEAYELLQIELDRSLKQFLLHLPEASSHKSQVQHFLNSWIEYICFVRHLSTWEEIVAKETEIVFLKWYEELGGEQIDPTLLKKFQAFFK